MRVLMVAQFFPPTVGGEERAVHDLSVELARRGHRVAVATLRYDDLPEYEEVEGVDVYRIRSTAGRFARIYSDDARPHAPPAVDPEVTRALERIAARERPEIVHGHNWLIHSFLPLKRRKGARLVVSLHDYSLICANKRLVWKGIPCAGPAPLKCLDCSRQYYGRLKGPAITMGNWLMSAAESRLVDLFLPVSAAVATGSGLVERGLEHVVIPNFIRDEEPRRHDYDALASLPEQFLLFVGDVTADKGAPVLVQAHASLDSPPPLVVIGRPGRYGELHAAPDRVRVLGPLPHESVLEAFRRCALAAVPSIVPEAFGIVALEAMAAGRPVVASRSGGLAELVVDQETGFLVTPGRADELAAALQRLVDDAELRSAMGDAARARASEFTAGRIVPLVETAYERVLGRAA